MNVLDVVNPLSPLVGTVSSFLTTYLYSLNPDVSSVLPDTSPSVVSSVEPLIVIEPPLGYVGAVVSTLKFVEKQFVLFPA